MCMPACMCMCVRTHAYLLRIHTFAPTHPYRHTYIHTNIHTHKRTHTHTHTHTLDKWVKRKKEVDEVQNHTHTHTHT